jgi:hypothetical protein
MISMILQLFSLILGTPFFMPSNWLQLQYRLEYKTIVAWLQYYSKVCVS